MFLMQTFVQRLTRVGAGIFMFSAAQGSSVNCMGNCKVVSVVLVEIDEVDRIFIGEIEQNCNGGSCPVLVE